MPHNDLTIEPYLIKLEDSSDVFPVFQHDGLEFIYMLEGEVDYRHGDNIYTLQQAIHCSSMPTHNMAQKR